MDWRTVVAGFTAGAGLVMGWLEFGTLGGAVLSAVLIAGLFAVGWAIDDRLYDP